MAGQARWPFEPGIQVELKRILGTVDAHVSTLIDSSIMAASVRHADFRLRPFALIVLLHRDPWHQSQVQSVLVSLDTSLRCVNDKGAKKYYTKPVTHRVASLSSGAHSDQTSQLGKPTMSALGHRCLSIPPRRRRQKYLRRSIRYGWGQPFIRWSPCSRISRAFRHTNTVVAKSEGLSV